MPLVAFVLGVILFFCLTNQDTQESTITEIGAATLPVVYLEKDGMRINELHGYTVEMEATSTRDTITPVESGEALPVSIDAYGNDIDAISYEVRSLDGSNLVLQSEAENITAADDVVTADLPIQNLLVEGEEYLLIMRVESSGSPCWFYTRIIEDDASHIDESIDFVMEFHNLTMQKDRQKALENYMEPTAGVDNSTLQTVTINNSLSQASWGAFEGTEETEPIVSIKELNDTYNVILLNYIMSSEDGDGETSHYNVEEYYRVRYSTEKMYLLSFERNVEEIFQGNANCVASDSLVLGIRSSDVDFRANETGNVVCFVQQGELWSYNADANTLTRVYSFRTEGKTDVRENYNEHDIRIVRIGETGSIDFIVYGYMNRGAHEGQVGISICHYDSVMAAVEEEMFIPSGDSYQMLKAKIGSEMYISDSGLFYLVVGDQTYCVDLNTAEYSVEISDMTQDNYASSDDGRYLAWTSEDADVASVMHLTDLESGVTIDVGAGAGYVIRPLGFMESDCIYGLAAVSDITGDSAIFPMGKVIVAAVSGSGVNTLKTYNAQRSFVTGITLENGNIYLHRMAYADEKYEDLDDDIIYNRDMQEESVYVSEIYDSVRQTEVTLHLSSSVGSDPNLIESNQIILDDVTLDLLNEDVERDYYVYAKGKVMLATDNVSYAVISADENRGVVIAADQSYVWKRAKAASAAISVSDAGEGTAEARALAIMLGKAGVSANVEELITSAMSAYQILNYSIPDGEVYNLTGCSLEQVLYYVGEGMPAYAVLYGQPVLVTGYDDTYATVYEPSTGETVTDTITEMTGEFASSGNIFYVVSMP